MITSSGVGGAERTLFNLLSRLDRNKTDIAGVLSLKPCGEYAEKIRALGIDVRSLDMGYLPSPADLPRLAALIKESGADTVHAFLFRAIQFCRLAKGKTPFRLLSSPRVNYRTRAVPLLWLDTLLRKRDDLTICESESSAAFLIKELGYEQGKVAVVKNGLDTGAWSFSQEQRASVRAALGLRPETLLIFSSGRLDTQKGYEYLLRALPAVAEKFTDFRLAIAGEGPLEAKLRTVSKEVGQDDKVLFLGRRSDVPALLSACDVFVLPSLWEGLPNSLLEAMSMGRPCVASGVDGARELLNDGENGLLTDAADSHSIAQALLRLAADTGLRERMGLAARSVAEKEYSFERMLSEYQAVYAEGQ
ncbi:MAG TPA: glycosyltransferase [Elusimicrobiales bacterium]|nr:glycosyltransferase [Elusimicrobiales bacterium]